MGLRCKSPQWVLLKTEQNFTPILALKNKGKIGTGFEGGMKFFQAALAFFFLPTHM